MCRRIANLALFLLTTIGRSHHLVGAASITRLIKHSADVVNKERVQEFGDLLLVGKLQGAFIGDPVTICLSLRFNVSQQAIH